MPSTTLTSDSPLRGSVSVRVRDALSGEVQRRMQIRNKILHHGYVALIALLHTGDPTRLLTRLRVGTGVRSPLVSDTDVAVPIPAAGPLYPYGKVDFAASLVENSSSVGGPYELVVSATVPGGSADDPFNGLSITEAALLLANGLAFARQIHPPIPKTPLIAIDYEWHVQLIPA